MDKILEALSAQKDLIGSKFDEVTSQFANMDTRVKELETRLTQSGSKLVSLPGVNEEKTKFSFLKAVNAILTKNWNDAGFEKEVFQQVEKAMGAATGSAGGYIVPAQYVAEIIEMLRAESVVMKLGATVLDNLSGSPVELPKQTGGATAYWVGENSAITTSDLTLGQLQLTPKQVAALVVVSNRLLKLSNPSAEAMIRRDIAQALSLAIDLAALRGSGTANQPLGIVNTPNVNSVAIGTDGGTFTFDHAVSMEGALEDANALRGNLGFAMHGKVKRKLKTLKVPQFSGQTDGEYRVGPISDAKLADYLGYQFGITTQIPTNLTKGSGTSLSEVYFGNWQELLIGQWGGLEILASTETSDAFAKNQAYIRVIQEVDCGLRHPESFATCVDAATT